MPISIEKEGKPSAVTSTSLLPLVALDTVYRRVFIYHTISFFAGRSVLAADPTFILSSPWYTTSDLSPRITSPTSQTNPDLFHEP